MPTVLIADDNRDVVFVMSHLLEEAGYTVVSANSTREALQRLDDVGGIELVLSDVRMPGEDGLALARALRERFPAIPIILMTGLAMAADEVPAGAGVLMKPIDFADLERAVKEKLGAGTH